ncbi:hypothetical protein [Kitasatospora sp. NPDC004531]
MVPTQGGTLPRRVNRRGSAPPQQTAPRAEEQPAPPPRCAREAQTFMSMFQAGTASGRSAAQQDRRPEGRHDEFPASPQLPQRTGDSHDHNP